MRILIGFICFGVIGSNNGSFFSLCELPVPPATCEFSAWDWPDMPYRLNIFYEDWPAPNYPTTTDTPELKSTIKTLTSTVPIISSTTTVPITTNQQLPPSTAAISSTTVPSVVSGLSQEQAPLSSFVAETIKTVKNVFSHPLAIYGICGIVLAYCVHLYAKSKRSSKQVQVEMTLLNDLNIIIKV